MASAKAQAQPLADAVTELVRLCGDSSLSCSLDALCGFSGAADGEEGDPRTPEGGRAELNVIPRPSLSCEAALAQAEGELLRLRLLRQAKAAEAVLAAQAVRESAGASMEALDAFSERCREARDGAAVAASDAASADVAAAVQELRALADESQWVARLRGHVEAALAIEAALGTAEEQLSEALRQAGASPGTPGLASALAVASSSLRSASHCVGAVALRRPTWGHLLSAAEVRLERAFATLRPAVVASLRDVIGRLGLDSAGEGEVKEGGSPDRKHARVARLAGRIPQAIKRLTSDASLQGHFARLVQAGMVAQVEQWGLKAVLATRERLRKVPTAVEEASLLQRDMDMGAEGASGGDVLWPMELLLQPVAEVALRYAPSWLQQPELVFALTLRIARASIDAVEDTFQPIMDQEGLVHLDAREEWVRAVVAGIPEAFLRSSFLPSFHAPPEAATGHTVGRPKGVPDASLWLHAVDQALSFDRIMAALVSSEAAASRATGASSGQLEEDEPPPPWATASVFAEQESWLLTWQRVELEDLLPRMEALIGDPDSWEQPAPNAEEGALREVDSMLGGPGLIAGADEAGGAGGVPQVNGGVEEGGCSFRPPAGAVALLGELKATAQRFRGVREWRRRCRLGQGLGVPMLERVQRALEARRLEAQAVSGMGSREDLVALCWRMNGVRFLHFELQQWTEQAFWTEGRHELQGTGGDTPTRALESEVGKGDNSWAEGWEILDVAVGPEGGEEAVGSGSSPVDAFVAAVQRLSAMLNDWMARLVDAQLRFFSGSSAEYVSARRHWEEQAEWAAAAEGQMEGPAELPPVSRTLLTPLALLEGRMALVKFILDAELYSQFSSRLGAVLESFLIDRVLFGGARFSRSGGLQFAADVGGVSSLFSPTTSSGESSGCLRRAKDAALLMSLRLGDVQDLRVALEEGPVNIEGTTVGKTEVLSAYGVLSLKPDEVLLILEKRIPVS